MNLWKRLFSENKNEPDNTNSMPSPVHTTVSPSSIPEVSSRALSDEERTRILAVKSLEFLHGKVEEVESGINNPFGVGLTIPGTDNRGILELSKRDKWQISIGIVKQGTDKQYTHYLCQGDKDKVLDYLGDDSSQEDLYNSIRELLNRVDSEE